MLKTEKSLKSRPRTQFGVPCARGRLEEKKKKKETENQKTLKRE